MEKFRTHKGSLNCPRGAAGEGRGSWTGHLRIAAARCEGRRKRSCCWNARCRDRGCLVAPDTWMGAPHRRFRHPAIGVHTRTPLLFPSSAVPRQASTHEVAMIGGMDGRQKQETNKAANGVYGDTRCRLWGEGSFVASEVS